MRAKTVTASRTCQGENGPASGVERKPKQLQEIAEIATRIRFVIAASGLSERAFAARCGLPATIFSSLLPRLDRDPAAVELRTLVAIAAGADVPLIALIAPARRS